MASRPVRYHYPKSLHNAPYQTLPCRPKVQMSGCSKVEMSAFPAQCRDARTPHVEHEATGSPAGPDADRRAAADAPARGGAAPDRRAPGATPLSRVRPGRRRGARVAPARSSECPPAPGRHPGARPGPHPRALRRLRAHVRPPEAHRGARPRPVRRDAARLDECRQLDGSEHAWFEDRGPRCTLLVYVDDATSRLMELCFADTESTFDYFYATRRYLERHGKPMAFYSDRLSVFHVQARDRAQGGPGLSQFGRALRALNIDSLCANSPQAKGRVERANGTLQDRLVKELRLRGLSTPAAAEPFLPVFMADYNRRFATPARVAYDAHQPLLPSEDLTEIFTFQELRRITAQLTVNYKRGLYVLEDSVENRRLRRTTALVSEAADGTVTIRGNGRVLAYRLHPRDHARLVPGVVVEHKHLDGVFAWIAAQQHDRDAARLANPKVTLRAKKRLRAAASSSASSVDP